MTSLKELRVSIVSVQSTKRITSAMKMVAAAKLRRATEAMESAEPYMRGIEDIVRKVKDSAVLKDPLMIGNGRDDTYLLVAIFSDRGLCGGFNGNLVRKLKSFVNRLEISGKKVKILIVGRKGIVSLRRIFSDKIVGEYEGFNKPSPQYAHAETIFGKIQDLLDVNAFDVCMLLHNTFVSALEQIPEKKQLIPLRVSSEKPKDINDGQGQDSEEENARVTEDAVCEYEPEKSSILKDVLPKNIIAKLYYIMLESFAAEQAARMTAMDNATRNATDIMANLSIAYNRSRQAQITKELVEIISGAEAL